MNIIDNNELFTVVYKPAGISAHPSPGDVSPNLVALLEKELPKKLGVITRLDRTVSGLVLLSANPKFIAGHELLKKLYQAIVFGQTEKSGQIDTVLTKKEFGSKKKVRQAALSKYSTLHQGNSFSLLEVDILTGRHHQIRKHLRSIGHPVIGDFRHGYNDRNLLLQRSYGKTLPLCLHCCQLKFSYRGKKYHYALPLSAEITELLNWLKASEHKPIIQAK